MATDPLPAGHTRVPNWLYEPDKADLDLYELAVIQVLLRHVDDRGECWPSYVRVARCARISRRKAVDVIGRLDDRGIVSVRRGGPNRPNVYRLHLDAARVTAAEGGAPDAPPSAHRAPPPSAPDAPPSAHHAPQVVHTMHPGGARGAPEQDPRTRPIEKEGSTSASHGAREDVIAPTPNAADDTRSNIAPLRRCPAHEHVPNPPRCGPCADARRAHEAWERANAEQAAEHAAEARERAEAARADAAFARQAEIDDCHLCDDRGYAGHTVCNHDPTTAERAARGIAAARAAIARKASA